MLEEMVLVSVAVERESQGLVDKVPDKLDHRTHLPPRIRPTTRAFRSLRRSLRMTSWYPRVSRTPSRTPITRLVIESPFVALLLGPATGLPATLLPASRLVLASAPTPQV